MRSTGATRKPARAHTPIDCSDAYDELAAYLDVEHQLVHHDRLTDLDEVGRFEQPRRPCTLTRRNVTVTPDYTSLLMLRPDPAGGGNSVAPAGDNSYGVADTVGNVREWTSTVEGGFGHIVVCGGGMLASAESSLWCTSQVKVVDKPRASTGFRVALHRP